MIGKYNMKKISIVAIGLSSIILLSSTIGFSQVSTSVLILIESPDFKLLQEITQFKTFHYDDDYLIGEIKTNNLSRLKSYNMKYQIIDPAGWSGEYYILTQQLYGPQLAKVKIGQTIYTDKKKSIVKIDSSEEQQLFTAGYQLEKITNTDKPLPKFSQYKMLFPTAQDSNITNIINKVSAFSLAAGVQRLQDFNTRYTYSDSIVPAAQWIYGQYVSYGYTDVKFDTFYLNNQPHQNVIATKVGLVYPDSVIMLGGHYDSIVSGQDTSPYVHAPGADDNASGTIAAIEVARVLADHEFQATIKFAAWDAEEVGLLGSQAYAQNAYFKNDPISLYMNFDMIGNITPQNNVTIYADAPTMPLAELTAQMARLYTSLSPSIPGNSGGSDHRSFQTNGYRAFFVQEGTFSPNWHKTTDVTNNMDFEYMKKVVQMGVATAIFLAGSAESLYGKPFVKYDTHIFSDDTSGSSFGNGNDYIDAGETIELAITLKNYGDSTAYHVAASLVTTDPYVTIIDKTQSFNSIPPQAISVNQGGFVFQVSREAPSGHEITFELQINDNAGNNWTDHLYLQVSMPDIIFHHQDVKEISGNGDDKIDPGELFNLSVELENIGLRPAAGITSILKCEHSSLTILDSVANFTNIPQSGFGNNFQDQFVIKINSKAKPEIIPLSLKIIEGKGFYQTLINFNLAIGQGRILLVEDDGGFDLSSYYIEAFNILGIPYLHWNSQQQGAVVEDTLMSYDRVIWYTGAESTNSLFKQGTKLAEKYLANGGNLFINGSLFPFSVRDSLIMSKYFHTKYISFNTELHHLKSEGAKPVLGDIDFWLSRTGDNSQSLLGEVDAQLPAQPILFYDRETSEGSGNILSSGAAAVAVADNNYRAVMFSFGWEGIENKEIRESVLIKVLNWLQETPTSIDTDFTGENLPVTFKLFQNYPNPFNLSTTIQFHVPKAGEVTLNVFNVLGQKIMTLINAKTKAGSYKVVWDGKDDHYQPVSSGVYFYQITAGDFQMTRKMILLY